MIEFALRNIIIETTSVSQSNWKSNLLNWSECLFNHSKNHTKWQSPPTATPFNVTFILNCNMQNNRNASHNQVASVHFPFSIACTKTATPLVAIEISKHFFICMFVSRRTTHTEREKILNRNGCYWKCIGWLCFKCASCCIYLDQPLDLICFHSFVHQYKINSDLQLELIQERCAFAMHYISCNSFHGN